MSDNQVTAMGPKTAQLLLIEDNELLSRALVAYLKREGYEVDTAGDGHAGLELLSNKSYDVLIVDVNLPGGLDGLDVLEQTSRQHKFRSKSIVITGHNDKEAPIRAIKLGVDHYLFKPFHLEELGHAVKKSMERIWLEQEAAHYRELSIRDGLTDLFNHRYFHEIFQRELVRAERYGHHLSVIMADIDNFKAFNDNHGHPMGDLALINVARIFETVLRGSDLAFRYGGEELAVLLPETDAQGGLMAAERLRRGVAEHPMQSSKGEPLGLTLSLGVATFPDHATSKEELISIADQSLYRAKQAGKNHVEMYPLPGA